MFVLCRFSLYKNVLQSQRQGNMGDSFRAAPQRLLLKLKDHGRGNDVINWIEKWLIDREDREDKE